jgi:hypothetical protein
MHESSRRSVAIGTSNHTLAEISPRASRSSIRAKGWFWRAPERRDAGGHENCFIAKNCDSESAQRALRRHLRLATASHVRLSSHARFAKRPAAIGFPTTLTNVSVGFSRTICIVARMPCRFAVWCASPAPRSPRQHFLKPDTVFFDVLVYSGCSAHRFPSARSDKAISLH